MNGINLSSQAWCDLIFDSKNKEYGAYSIRMESSKRHLKALLVVVAFCLLSIFLSSWLNNNSVQASARTVEHDGPIVFVNLDDNLNVSQPVETAPPPLIPIVASIKFDAPIIVPDEEVTEENAMKTQIELSENSHAVIAGVTTAGNTDGPGMVITDIEPIAATPSIDNTVHVHVEQMPVFPGGDAELMSFLRDNLKYPVMAVDKGVQGTVSLRFVVDKDGSVGEIEILRPLDPSCDKEAVRVAKKMPKWIPGKQNGREVRVYYTLPVRFRLAN